MDLVLHLLRLIRTLASDRARLTLENVVLHQQLNVLQRSVKRAKVDDSDRIFWVMMCRFFQQWKEHLVIVKPETVVRWLSLRKTNNALRNTLPSAFFRLYARHPVASIAAAREGPGWTSCFTCSA